MKMLEIRNKFYDIYPGDEVRHKGSYIASLKYLDSLASITKTDISDWDVTKLFAAKNQGGLVLDKKQINRIFFETKELGSGQQVSELTEMQVAQVRAGYQQHFDSKQQVCRNIITTTRQKIRDLENRIFDEQYRLCAAYKDLLTLEKTGDCNSLISRLNEVIKTGRWDIVSLIRSSLTLRLKHPIMLKELNKAAKIDYTVNLGQPTVNFDLITNNYKVVRDQAPRLNTPHPWHPHVDSSPGGSGTVCAGDQSVPFKKAQASGDLVTFFDYIYQILHVFNPDHPYRQLHRIRDDIAEAEKLLAIGVVAPQVTNNEPF